MKLKIFKNLFIYLLLFTPLSLGMISCSGNNKSNAKFKEEITADIIPPITAVAALLLLSLLGIVIFYSLSLIEWLALRRWHESFQSKST